jgi:predicted RNA binding protein YcfA (HicA-like mRNA interferase family)
MSGQHPPLTCAEFKAVLKKLGFQYRNRKKQSTGSHEDWVGTYGGQFRKVTVDCPKAPFSHDLIRSMAKQAGVTTKIVYDVHFSRLDPAAQPPI